MLVVLAVRAAPRAIPRVLPYEMLQFSIYLRSFLNSTSCLAAPLQYLSLSNLSTTASTFSAGSFAASIVHLTGNWSVKSYLQGVASSYSESSGTAVGSTTGL